MSDAPTPTSFPGSGPGLAARLAVAAGIALLCVLVLLYDSVAEPNAVPDFDQTWFAARALLGGRDPYALIGEGREYDWPWAYYYPLTAPLSVLPLGYFALPVARMVFVAMPAGVLAFALTRHGYGRLPLFASGAFLMSVKTAQWAPLMTCALLYPYLGFLVSAKPNLGAGVVAGARSRRALVAAGVGSVALVILSVLVQPEWIGRWLAAVRTAPHFVSPILAPGGFVLLLAVLRWRRWEARLLLALAMIPQTPNVASALPLLLIPRSMRSLIIVAILSYLPLLHRAVPATFAEWARGEVIVVAAAVFLPVLWLILRMPNSGPLPARIEAAIARWPSWIRGSVAPHADPLTIEVPASRRDSPSAPAARA